MAALATVYLLFTTFVLVFANHVRPLPARTVQMDDGYAASGWTPKPTTKPLQKDLFKRQNYSVQAGFPSSICGYITSDLNEPYYCEEGNYCGIATELGAYGCCSTYSPTTLGNVVSYILSNCSYFQTRCWDSTAVAQWNYTNYLEQWCGDPAYPYCETYTSFNGDATLLDCWTKPGTYLLSNPIPRASMPVIPDAAITSAEISWKRGTLTSSSSTRPTSTISPGSIVGTLPGSSSSIQPTSTASTSPASSPVSSTSGAAPSQSSAVSNSGLQSVDGVSGVVAAGLLSIAWLITSLVEGHL